MRKSICFILFVLFLIPLVTAEELNTELFLLISQDKVKYAQNGGFVNIFPAENDVDTAILKEALSKPFNIEWTDNNFQKDKRKMLSSLLSPILSTLLPSEKILFSVPVVGIDNSKSFRIKDLKEGNIYSVVMKGGRIISMSFEENDGIKYSEENLNEESEGSDDSNEQSQDTEMENNNIEEINDLDEE